MIRATRLNGETVAPDGKRTPISPVFILYHDVRQGETVDLPTTSEAHSVIPIARKIEFQTNSN